MSTLLISWITRWRRLDRWHARIARRWGPFPAPAPPVDLVARIAAHASLEHGPLEKKCRISIGNRTLRAPLP